MKPLLILVSLLLVSCTYGQDLDDMYLTVEELCDKYGYPYEEHTVHTVDGYILTVNRIPYGRNSETQEPGEPLLMVHSLGHSAPMWLSHGPEESPAFFFANQGHDVWLINLRTTIPSMGHEEYNWRIDMEYWNITFYHYNYDWEATIRYMLEVTDYTNIAAVLSSFRASNSLMGIATTPDFYHENISVWILISPQFRFDFSETPNLRNLMFSTAIVDLYDERRTPWYWLPKNALMSTLAFVTQDYICENYPVLCMELYNPHTNRQPSTDDIDSFRVIAGHLASTTPSRDLIHCAQQARTGLRYYDYGEEINMDLYGAPNPPMPPFEDINVPTAVIAGTNDLYTAPNQVHSLLDMLGDNLIFFNIYNYDTYGYYVGADILNYLEDLQTVLEEYPPQRRQDD